MPECPCPCHNGPDHCAICSNDYSDLCGADEVTVCPDHLRFVPCRRCEPGNEHYSTDPADVERTRRFQWDNRQAVVLERELLAKGICPSSGKQVMPNGILRPVCSFCNCGEDFDDS